MRITNYCLQTKQKMVAMDNVGGHKPPPQPRINQCLRIRLLIWKFPQSSNQNAEVFVSEFVNDVYIYC